MPFAHKVHFRAASLAFFLIAFLFASWNISPTSTGAAPAVHAPIVSPAANAQLLNAYAKLPLSFEVNRGQAEATRGVCPPVWWASSLTAA